jgi:DNA-binding HxlR family transcriptional regulator
MDKNDTIEFLRSCSDKVMLMARSTARSSGCGCPVAAFQKMISGKYKLRIMWDIQDGPKRYGEIRSGLLRGAAGTPEIAPRVLSRELKALALFGLVDRKDYGVVPPKVEYRLTRKGRSFIPIIAAIRKWGARHLGEAGDGDRQIASIAAA